MAFWTVHTRVDVLNRTAVGWARQTQSATPVPREPFHAVHLAYEHSDVLFGYLSWLAPLRHLASLLLQSIFSRMGGDRQCQVQE